jgi:hypothetical protein
MRVVRERRVRKLDLLNGPDPQRIITELASLVRDEAVLKNAEGWQSGDIEYSLYEQPWDFMIKVKVWMEMTRDDEQT